ncbi:hypothetical protein CVT26_000493 [Gymnopilus dilepis]|uniref:non-specific serine/threonine protein kinase n=1 Tax=Gymnopilus dilepis TaxID=231916 RepID=A0A409VH24_9AGAR|nr:hypothetical protein CVT26_000493 [Gymnopilus dilepis]
MQAMRATNRLSRARWSLPRLHLTVRHMHLPAVRDWTSVEEQLEGYESGGYAVMSVGDIMGSRYRVLRKLGWGRYSTVWLVRDEHEGASRYAALKALTGVASDAPELHELEYLERIRDSSPNHPGRPHVIQLLDHFYHRGPFGKHLCLLTDALTEDLWSFPRRWRNRVLPTNLVRQIARQLLLALSYLHDECNIIHTDIKPSNILLVSPDGPVCFEDAVKADGPPEMSTGRNSEGILILRTRSRPLLYPLPLENANLEEAATWNNVSVKLADVGVACWADKVSEHFTPLIQSTALRAPEVAIGAGWGRPADVWSLGCTIYELIMGQSLFLPDMLPESVPYFHTMQFGQYPLEMIQRGEFSRHFFKEDGSINMSLPKYPSLAEKIYANRAIRDVGAFVDFLQSMLVLDPDKRASCRDLIDHEWLKS